MNRTKLKKSEASSVVIMLVSSVSIAFLPTSEKLAFNYETTVTALLLARLLIGLLLLSLFLFSTGEKFSLLRSLVLPVLFLGFLLWEL
jgi:hypothetical protein